LPDYLPEIPEIERAAGLSNRFAMPFKFYFFSGSQYIRVTREDTGPGSEDDGYPKNITEWGWPKKFGSSGIDAALYSGSKCYFFRGSSYVRVTRGTEGPGSQDFTEPHPISEWGWPGNFGAKGIDAALWSGPVTFFFSGANYISVTRRDDEFGDASNAKILPISDWPFPTGFGRKGIKGAVYSGSVCYFFDEAQYIRVHRGIYGLGRRDPGYPRLIADVWAWRDGFGADGIDAALYSGGDLVPIPPLAGLPVGTNWLTTDWNYFLYSGGAPLTGVTAVINIDENLTIDPEYGAGFQLNCYSQVEPRKDDFWQQFVFEIDASTNQVWAVIAGWSGQGIHDEFVFFWGPEPVCTLDSGVIPAGCIFEIQVHAGGASFPGNNITGATFSVYQNVLVDGHFAEQMLLGTQLLNIIGQKLWVDGVMTSNKATYEDCQPIVAMTFNVSSSGGGNPALLSGASGSVTISASQALTALNTEPAPLNFLKGDQETGENSNVICAQLPQTANTSISQIFDIFPLAAPNVGFHAEAVLPSRRRKFRPLPMVRMGVKESETVG
jgi:hypothetical protein